MSTCAPPASPPHVLETGDGAPVGAVLLAGGAGSRLGGRPKSLLELDGVPLIRRQLIALADARIGEVVVVLGHHAAAIEPVVAGFPVTVVHNRSPDDGQGSSVMTGLRALTAHHEAVIVALADQPMIRADDIVALIQAFRRRGVADMVTPRVDGLPGNPVMFSAALRDEWLAGSANATGRRWREAHPERLCWFDSDRHAYLIDIDTPEDMERFQQLTGHALLWPPGLA